MSISEKMRITVNNNMWVTEENLIHPTAHIKSNAVLKTIFNEK